MNTSKFWSILLGAILISGCGETVQQKVNKQISVGVYATKDSVDVSRYDLAKSYINETTRLVPPPLAKDRIKIPAFTTSGTKAVVKKGVTTTSAVAGTHYVVLPDTESNQHVIVENSDEYKQLLHDNADLQKKEQTVESNFATYKTTTDKTLSEQAAELAKYRAQPNIFVRVWHFITGFLKWGTLGIIIVIVGLLIASIFIQPLLPFVFEILKAIGGVIGLILGLITKGISALMGLFQKKPTT